MDVRAPSQYILTTDYLLGRPQSAGFGRRPPAMASGMLADLQYKQSFDDLPRGQRRLPNAKAHTGTAIALAWCLVIRLHSQGC